MVIFPPYLASSLWYHHWFRSFISSDGDNCAIIKANLAATRGKDLARCVILTSHDDILKLSVPVEGGARQLRQTVHDTEIHISEHGNWRKTHLSAIEASYGKYPFFSHIYPLLKEVLTDKNLTTLNQLNLRLHNISMKLLTRDITSAELNLMETPLIIDRGKEIAKSIKPEISITDALMCYGPEAILGIFALYR